MNPIRKEIVDLADRAKTLHEHERRDSVESVDLVGQLLRRNASTYLFLDSRQLAARIGLTPNQFWKRTQVARVLYRFPEFRDLLFKGETTVSKLSLIAPRITNGNKKFFLEGIRGKSARQVACLVNGVDHAGRSLTSQSRRQVGELSKRASEVALARGRQLNLDAIIKEALELWLVEWGDVGPAVAST